MAALPKELRIIVYYVLDNQIINPIQRKQFEDHFMIDPFLIRQKKKECLASMDSNSNFWSYVYVHATGELETEVNVSRSKYAFHPEHKSQVLSAKF